ARAAPQAPADLPRLHVHRLAAADRQQRPVAHPGLALRVLESPVAHREILEVQLHPEKKSLELEGRENRLGVGCAHATHAPGTIAGAEAALGADLDPLALDLDPARVAPVLREARAIHDGAPALAQQLARLLE